MEDVEGPALEVGEHDVRPGQPLIDVGAGGQRAGQMPIAGSLEAGVTAAAVGLHEAAGDDGRACRSVQALGAGGGDEAQVGAPEAAACGVRGGHGVQRPAGLAASATLRPRAPAANEALVELDDAAQQELALAARHGMDDLAPHEPGGLTRPPELTGKLGRRRSLLRGGEQPDGQEPLAQIGTCAGEDCAGGQGALEVAAGALIEAAATEVPSMLMPAATTAEALR